MPAFHRAVTAISRQAVFRGAQRQYVVARSISASALKSAIAHPITTHGPPPKAPSPTSANPELLQKDAALHQKTEKSPLPGKPSVLKKRFWKNVDVKQKPGTHFFSCDQSIWDTCVDMFCSQMGTIRSC